MRTSLYSILCIVVRPGATLLFVQTVVSLPGAREALRVREQETVLKLALGLGLAFGAHGPTGTLHRLRERGRAPAWPDPAADETSSREP